MMCFKEKFVLLHAVLLWGVNNTQIYSAAIQWRGFGFSYTTSVIVWHAICIQYNICFVEYLSVNYLFLIVMLLSIILCLK